MNRNPREETENPVRGSEADTSRSHSVLEREEEKEKVTGEPMGEKERAIVELSKRELEKRHRDERESLVSFIRHFFECEK